MVTTAARTIHETRPIQPKFLRHPIAFEPLRAASWTVIDDFQYRRSLGFRYENRLELVLVAEAACINYNPNLGWLISEIVLRSCISPMIAHLSGTLFAKSASSVILDVGGVGYEVTIPLSTFYGLEEAGASVALRIYTHVREDALQLYGFRTARERELFMRLISISGIGPKLGITMLSGMSADEIIVSIRTNNLARLTSIPGIGRKTAERLVVELRDKIAVLSSPALEEEFGAPTGAPVVTDEEAVRADALSALINLDYPKAAAEKAVLAAVRDGSELTVEAVLRRALRHLAKG